MRRPLVIGIALLLTGGLCVILYALVDVLSTPNQIIETDILVYGSGLGGTSSALVAARQGARVVLATEHDVIGGQAVESGVSAFDDLRKPWEQWGLYLDLQNFLREKYGIKDEDTAGLGHAAVGRVASPPSDIEEFFRKRIDAEQHLTLLTDYDLLSLRRQWWFWGPWEEADLFNRASQQKVRIRFRYLVDGTATGKILEKSATPFRIGFDSKEETGERYALTADERWFFTSGMEQSGSILGKFGNRIQAVTSPFALLDRGFPGDFFPVNAPETACRAPKTASGFVAGAKLFATGNPTCVARISILPEFSDTYDMYLVHHGGGTISNVLLSTYWPDDPLSLSTKLSPEDTFTFLGTFPAGPKSGLTLLVTAGSQPMLIEGVIMVKRNIAPAPPLVFRPPLPKPLSFVHLNPAPVVADVYVIGATASDENITVDGTSIAPETAGPQVTRYSHVSLSQESRLLLPSSLQISGSSIIVIPIAPSLTRLTFAGDTPNREIPIAALEAGSSLSKSGLPVREWDFTAPEDGNAAFMILSNSPEWRLLELWSDDPSSRLLTLSFVANNVTRNPRPLFSAPLRKGTRYRMRIAVAGNGKWDPFDWSLAFMQGSALMATSGNAELTLPPQAYRGLYDIWVQAPVNAKVLLSLSRPDNLVRSWPVLINHAQYEYAGKAFLDQATALRSSAETVSLLVIPNQHVNNYLMDVGSNAPSAPLQLSTLPPGRFRTIFTGKGTSSVSISALPEGATSAQSLSFAPTPAASAPALSPDVLFHNGLGLSLTLPQETENLRLFEEVPNLQDTWTFNMSLHPLLGDPEKEPVPLFRFRNIVAPAQLLGGAFKFVPPSLGTNTQGVTLVINPSNDLSGILANQMDSPDITATAKAHSAAYAYWMHYDAALTRQNLGCDPDEFSCSPKRTQMIFGMFSDPASPFPPLPYIRESRRMIGSRTVSYEDLAPAFGTCEDDVCPKQCYPLPRFPGLCLSDKQHPLIFPDALAAIGYAIDIHPFYTEPEYYAAVKGFLAALKERTGGDEPLLLKSSWQMIFARPAEVPLSALIAQQGGNVFPSANNMSLTQIANGLFRTHANEMAIGQAVGGLLGAALTQKITPSAFMDSPLQLRSLQHELVERGFVLYPVEDMMTDAPLRSGVQHLIVEGLLSPSAILPEKKASMWGTVTYRVFPKSDVDDQDLPAIKSLFPAAQQPLTYRHLLSERAATAGKTTDEDIKEYGLSQKLIDESHRSLPTEKLLNSVPSKGDLYRTASYLLVH